MKLKNNVLRFRSPEPQVDTGVSTSKPLPPKLHPKVKRRRLIWLILMVFFFGWCIVQLVVQEIRIANKEEVLHKRQQELSTVEAANKKLKEDVKRYEDKDFLMEQAHKHGYGKPGEKNVPIENE